VKARVPRPGVGIEDPESRPPPRWTEPAPTNGRVRPLAHDVPTEPDPCPSGQLEAKRGGLGHRPGERGGQVGRLDDEQERARAARDCSDPVEAIGGGSGASGTGVARAHAGAEIENRDVHDAALEERPGHRERLVERLRHEDGERLEPDTARHCLDRIERPSDVDPRRERSRRLRLGDEAERKRRRPARPGTAQRDRRGERHAARAEDRVEVGEAGRDDRVAPS
jgi:hypothetical protein